MRDFHYAFRQLLNRPGFSAIAVLTLAVGIGVTTAVFSIANWLLIRPVPGVENPDELVTIRFQKPDMNYTGTSYANLNDLLEATPALESLVGYAPTFVQAQIGAGRPLGLRAKTVVGTSFHMLGISMVRGRAFTATELAPGSDARAAVISYGLWQREFAGAANVIGRTLRVNGYDFTVVGVAPEGFQGIERRSEIRIWFPGPVYAQLRHFDQEDSFGQRDFGIAMTSVGRLAPGATPEQAQLQLRQAMDGLIASYPDANAIYSEYVPTVYAGIGLEPRLRDRTQNATMLLMGLVAIVLLITCANVANLLIFRAARQRGETAVRRALGASFRDLFRHHLAQGLVLGLAASAAGVLFSMWVLEFLGGMGLAGMPPVREVGVDGRVLAFALALAVGTALFFAIVPTTLARRLDVAERLKDAAPTGTGRTARLRRGLTVVQLAASLALLVSALLLVRTLSNLRNVDLGFESRGVSVFLLDVGDQGYTSTRIRTFRDRVLDALGRLPGSAAVTMATRVPFHCCGGRIRLDPADGTGDEPIDVNVVWVAPSYFSTLGIPLRAGRDFTRAEYNRSPEQITNGVIISRALARRLYGDSNPIGQVIHVDGFRGAASRRVIGIAANVRMSNLRGTPEPVIYRPLGAAPSFTQGTFYALVRSARPVSMIQHDVLEAIAGIDARIPVRATELFDGIRRRLREERLFTRLLGLLAILAAGLAAVGLYGVVAYSVAERTREFGLRMALGADRGMVTRIVLREAGALAIAGAVVGLAGAVGLAQLVESKLFGVESLDWITYMLAVVGFACVALIAAAFPSLAATRVDPMEALRHE